MSSIWSTTCRSVSLIVNALVRQDDRPVIHRLCRYFGVTETRGVKAMYTRKARSWILQDRTTATCADLVGFGDVSFPMGMGWVALCTPLEILVLFHLILESTNYASQPPHNCTFGRLTWASTYRLSPQTSEAPPRNLVDFFCSCRRTSLMFKMLVILPTEASLDFHSLTPFLLLSDLRVRFRKSPVSFACDSDVQTTNVGWAWKRKS